MTRGDLYFIDFEPSVGAEIKKKRPALIISCNEANRHLKTLMVIPFSSKVKNIYPFEVLVKKEESGLKIDSKLKIPQSGQGHNQMGYRPLPIKNCTKKHSFTSL